jgi:hypothetical protein
MARGRVKCARITRRHLYLINLHSIFAGFAVKRHIPLWQTGNRIAYYRLNVASIFGIAWLVWHFTLPH